MKESDATGKPSPARLLSFRTLQSEKPAWHNGYGDIKAGSRCVDMGDILFPATGIGDDKEFVLSQSGNDQVVYYAGFVIEKKCVLALADRLFGCEIGAGAFDESSSTWA